MIKFSRPKKGEIRYLAFMSDNKLYFWLQKVKMTYTGKDWFHGEIIKFIAGEKEYSTEIRIGVKLTGQYNSFCFLETEADARKLLILAALDTRNVNLFFRDYPDIEDLI